MQGICVVPQDVGWGSNGNLGELGIRTQIDIKKKKKASSQNQKEKKGIEQHSVPVDVDYHGEIWL